MSTSQERLVEWFTGDPDREVTAAAAEAVVRTTMPHVKPGSERFYSLVLGVARRHAEDE
jgi:hypothetical protein